MEKHLESKLRKAVMSKGGLCLKFVSPGNRGAPDRIVLMPGKTYFVETKSKTGKPTKIQLSMHRMLETIGHPVTVISNDQQLKQFIDAI